MIELMAAVALLSLIILGLVAMFSETRRAFTSTLTQVDVLESGRSVADFISREMEQIAPFGNTKVPNFFTQPAANGPSGYSQFIWPLNDPTDFRTNNLEGVFFLTRNNQQWNIIGYKVFPTAGGTAIGTLYRFSQTFTITNSLSSWQTLSNKITTNLNNFTAPKATPGAGYTRLVDGVVDFRVRAYSTNGNQFTNGSTQGQAFVIVSSGLVPGDYTYEFRGGSVPAYVEVELGVVEDRVLAHYNALTNTSGVQTAAQNYLTNHAAQIHIFRQRVPIANVNPAAL